MPYELLLMLFPKKKKKKSPQAFEYSRTHHVFYFGKCYHEQTIKYQLAVQPTQLQTHEQLQIVIFLKSD